MNCPTCRSAEVQALKPRNALYPAGIVAIFGLAFTLLHHTASPVAYHCHGCGSDFGCRTTIGKFAHVALFLLVAGLIALVALIVYTVRTGGA